MTAELDADIARMVAIAHARRTLGWSYYNEATTPKPRQRPTARAEREARARYRARKADKSCSPPVSVVQLDGPGDAQTSPDPTNPVEGD